MTDPRSDAVHFDRVVKTYGPTRAVDNITLTIDRGAFVALVGASGSGKSTLLKTVNRLIELTEGNVAVFGENVDAVDAHALRRRIGYVFQSIGLFPHMTVGENIGIGPRIAGGSIDREHIGELLDMVDLSADMIDRTPDALSGGQQQRVGIARALAGHPELLLMDEPFGALDPVTRDALGKRVRALHDELGLTTVMVTHDMAEALLLADRVLVMERGQIVADAAPAELLAGKGGDVAQALVAVPRRQSEELAELAR